MTGCGGELAPQVGLRVDQVIPSLRVVWITWENVKVLSYFVGDSDYDNRYMGDFKKMYGKDAKFIDVNSVSALAKTMNKKFLEK